MSTHPKLNRDRELLKIKTKDDEIKELEYKTQKHDYENILKSLKIDNEYYKKKYKSLNKKKVFMIVSEMSIGSVGLGVGSGLTDSGLAPVGIMCASSISILSNTSTLITNEYFSELKIRYKKSGDWTEINTLLYEKTLKTSIVGKKELVKKKLRKLKRFIITTLIKKIMKDTSFKLEDVFRGKINKDSVSPEQITKFSKFLTKTM